MWKQIENFLTTMITLEEKKLLNLGRRVIPTLTPEDLLQPNDYPDLETNPTFRYDEGRVAGLKQALVALRALKKDCEKESPLVD